MGPDGPESAAEAILHADMDTLLPKLYEAADRILHMVGLARRTGILEVKDLVDETLVKCWTGERSWVPGAGATEERLVRYLCKTMSSVAVNRRTSADVAQRAGGDALNGTLDESPSPSRQFHERALLARIEHELAGDSEAMAVYGMLAEEYTRDEIAATLQCDVKHVKVVLRRARRHLTAKGISPRDDGEDQQPISSE
jgi:DNA-directed RNA polymerase specialized sigma24 family protein